MENTTKKPIALWRKLILLIPLGVIAFCWMFYFMCCVCVDGGIEDLFRSVGRMLIVCGWAVMAGSAALILALIPTVFVRPLSGGTEIKVLHAAARCLLFIVLSAVISFQCIGGVVCFWALGY